MSDDEDYLKFLQEQSVLAPPLIPDAVDPDEDDADDIDDEGTTQQTLERQRHPRSARHDDGQAYVDKLTEAATKAATEAIAPHLAKVQELIENAETPDELRKQLKRLAREVKHGHLEALIRNSRLMAHAAGRTVEIDDEQSEGK